MNSTERAIQALRKSLRQDYMCKAEGCKRVAGSEVDYCAYHRMRERITKQAKIDQSRIDKIYFIRGVGTNLIKIGTAQRGAYGIREWLKI